MSSIKRSNEANAAAPPAGTARTILGSLALGLVELVLPRVCVLCERPVSARTDALACETCWSRVATLPFPRCERCGHPGGVGSCRWCPLLPPYVRAARSVCWIPGGVAEQILYAFKYEGWHRLAPEIATRMARLTWPSDVLSERGALIPVPLAASRLRERGYNQSALLAAAIAGTYGVPVWNALERRRATSTQTRLTPDQRLTNVASAFAVVSGAPSRLRGAHVVLVDDVVTTAATLNECATVLFDAGARIVSYVTFGRARAPGDAPLTRGSANHGS